MSTAAWAALAAVAGQIGAGLLLAWRAGAWAGQVGEVLGALKEITGDHETRLRAVERGPGAHARHR